MSSLGAVNLRSLRARKLRSLLSAAAIVLGVGMVFAVLLLVGTIHSTFDRLYDSFYGNTDIVVSGENAVGSMPEATIDRVRATRGVETASGTLVATFRRVDASGRADRDRAAQIYVVGVDYREPDPKRADRVAGRRPRSGPEIELARDWAVEQGISPGDRLRLATPTGIATLTVVGLYEFEGGLDLGGYGTASMPVDEARRIMDRPGVWDEISVVVEDGADVGAVRARLDADLGRGVDVLTAATKGEDIQEQLATFDVVLYFFSGIALFVGGFLILNSFNMTVFQRIRELGTLRALGASRARIARTVVGEALVLGAVGCVLGLGVGMGLAELLTGAMRSSGLPVSEIEFSAGALVAAVLTGLLATLAGAVWPAVRAGRVEPIRALVGGREARRPPRLRRAVIGVATFVPGLVLGGLLWFGNAAQSGGVLTGIGAIAVTMMMFVGMALLAPFVVLPLARLLAVPLRAVMPAEGRLASDAAQSNPRRTAATAATLLIALSVVVVNATMASSFVGSLSDELDRRLQRDLTVQPLGYQEFGPPQSPLSPALRDRIAALPEAGDVARRRALYLGEMPGDKAQEGLAVAYDPYEWDRVDRPDYEGADRAEVLRGLASGGVVLAKGFAEAAGLQVGDSVDLDGPSGARRGPVVGIADTFDAGGGRAIYMSLETMTQVYGAQGDFQLAVKARSPDARRPLEAKVNALLERDYPGAEALSNAEIKQENEDLINQQFGLFNAIVGIAVIVGAFGIVNTLSMSVLERTREIGVLRALGASRWRVRRAMGDESLLISLAGTIAGMVAGLVIAAVWVLAVSNDSFPGMHLKLPVGMLVTVAIAGVVIGVVAAILPARRAAKLDPLTALRYE